LQKGEHLNQCGFLGSKQVSETLVWWDKETPWAQFVGTVVGSVRLTYL